MMPEYSGRLDFSDWPLRGKPSGEYECVWCLARAAVYVQYHLADKVTDTASESLRRLFWAASHGA